MRGTENDYVHTLYTHTQNSYVHINMHTIYKHSFEYLYQVNSIYDYYNSTVENFNNLLTFFITINTWSLIKYLLLKRYSMFNI